MNQQLKKLAVLLVSKKKDQTCLPIMQQIRNKFPQHTYLIDDEYQNEPVDLVVTIGGDGTILQSSKTSVGMHLGYSNKH
ncbi:unnamed protein product [Paramecium sonneborni]|uniref:NAD(+) kinase n=1 Tax=Paramecium sonneborni TaxID=65129 RepID=A0A8S1LPG2_9CILI|nr:unnamed protein product [Paramecium sonneborni]